MWENPTSSNSWWYITCITSNFTIVFIQALIQGSCRSSQLWYDQLHIYTQEFGYDIIIIIIIIIQLQTAIRFELLSILLNSISQIVIVIYNINIKELSAFPYRKWDFFFYLLKLYTRQKRRKQNATHNIYLNFFFFL